MKSIQANINKDRYLHLSKLGSELSLSFSSHLALGSKLIGLDGIKKKLLVCEFVNDQPEHNIVELKKVKSISVKKIYSGIKAGELNERRFEEFIKTINLHFEFFDAHDDVDISFYESGMDEVVNVAGLEIIVKKWQTILSKIIGIKSKEIIKEIDLGKLQPLDRCVFHVTTVFK